MMTSNRIKTVLALAALVITVFAFNVAAGDIPGSQPDPGATKPLKVYILAGQSNMEGHAKVETFDYIGDDQATAPRFASSADNWLSRLYAPRILNEPIG